MLRNALLAVSLSLCAAALAPVATAESGQPAQPQMRLCKYPLGSISGEGWLKQDLNRLAGGMGGWFQYCFDVSCWKKSAGMWPSEFACTALHGQVMLGWTSGDAAIQRLATANIDKIVSAPFKGADGYIGFAGEQLRKNDYQGWAANQEIMALLLFYEANPSRTDARDAARDYALWLTRNWNRAAYEDPKNCYRNAPTGDQGNTHGYVGPCVLEAVLEVLKHYPKETALLDWARDYQDWINVRSAYQGPKVQNMLSATYWPNTHAGAIGVTAKSPGILSSWDPALPSYREATLNGLQRILDSSLTPAGGIDDKGERLTRCDGPFGDMEYCNFQSYQEAFRSAGAISGEAKWFDYAEKMIFNAAKGATRKDWTAAAYMSRVNQYTTGTPFQEYKWAHDPPCCSLRAVASLPHFVDHMFMHDAAGNVFLTEYGPARLQTDGSLLLTETTEYPFDKHITLTFAKAFDKDIMVKVPVWCNDGRISVSLNGTAQTIKNTPGIFAAVRKNGGFAAGDSISIVFDKMESVEVKRSPLMKDYIWIERGPLTFACDVPAKWSKYPLKGHDGYRLTPADGSADLAKSYFIDISDTALKETAQVLTDAKASSGFPWESPPVRIRIKVKSGLDKGAEKAIELVPYGCTALRTTCFVSKQDAPVKNRL